MAKKSLKKQFKEAQQEPKQLVVGGIIFLVAILLLVFSFVGGKTPAKASATATSETKPTAMVEKPIAVAQQGQVAAEVPAEPVVENVTEEIVAEKEISEGKPQNVVVTFEAVLEKDFPFQVFYIEKAGDGYTEEKSVIEAGTVGTRTYNIVLPVSHISGLRLDYGEQPENVTIRNIKLLGAQTADLSNFSEYETNQMANITINEDGSLSFSSEEYDPYMWYKAEL